MRSAGDAAVRCPTRQLANRSQSNIFVYEFLVTPGMSLNFGDTSTMGAFHGAEVPFVFGDVAELIGEDERRIATTMGCHWRSFALHGDPNVEDCGTVPWPRYNEVGSPVL